MRSGVEPEGASERQRAVLEKLRAFLWWYGTANDAQDHGAEAEAGQLRRKATAGIQDLLREHAFLADLFPGLGADVGTSRMETSAWSTAVDAVERRLQFVHVDHIPWDRVVHFQGRATDVPDWIGQLGRASHAAAEHRLRECLVRDGRIVQATPLAVRLILGAVRFGLLQDPAAVGAIVQEIGAAASRQVEAGRRGGTRPPRVDWSLFRNDRLWPPFESVGRDEAFLAEWSPSEEEALGWAMLARRLIDEHEEAVMPTAAKAPRLFRVILPVADMAAAESFYAKLLGAPGRRVSPQRHYFDAGDVILALVDPRGDEGASDVRPNQEYVYFAVGDLAHRHALAAELGALDSAMGAIAERPWGERSFYAHDPFGNPICFVDEKTLFTGR